MRHQLILITENTITVEQAKYTTSMTWVLPHQIKCYYRHHGPIKYLEKHDVLNYPFLLFSSVMIIAVMVSIAKYHRNYSNRISFMQCWQMFCFNCFVEIPWNIPVERQYPVWAKMWYFICPGGLVCIFIVWSISDDSTNHIVHINCLVSLC